jgi:hypothetical protein
MRQELASVAEEIETKSEHLLRLRKALRESEVNAGMRILA